MASSDDDEDLRLAIALSLQASQGLESHPKVVHGSSATQAIDLDGPQTVTVDNAEGKVQAVCRGGDAEIAVPNPNFLGLDRKKMEQERLSRKRKASISPPPARKATKVTEHTGSGIDTSVSKFAAQLAQTGRGPEFPHGTVKKTWAFGHAREGDDIKLEEVLAKDDLQAAVLSSFQWDVGWLLAKINTSNTQITMVMQAKDEATKQQYRQETAEMSNLRLCFPSMEGQVNCMHSKLMLLSHPTYLRIAVPTANLVSYDWGETGSMENMVFIIDLPRLSGNQRTSVDDLPFFGRELMYFLKAMALERSIVDSLHKFDFSATKNFAFVHTIGGAHTGPEDPWRRTGYCGLGRAVQELNLATKAPLNIDFVTSSVGSLNMDFLSSIYLACEGDDGLREYNWRNLPTSKSKSAKQGTTAEKQSKNAAEQGLRVYFPTHNTVRASTAGYAGTICFQSKWYNSPTFPRQILRDCKSTRPGMLMHNKLLLVRPATPSPTSSASSWAYVGSANCSESAWGKLVKDRATKSPKLNCRNWECGVVIPARRWADVEEHGKGVGNGLGEFRDIPVPMQYPGEEYGDKRPWFYSEG